VTKLKAGLRLAALTCAFASAPLVAQKVAAPPPQPIAAPSYAISPGDELEIHVWGEERLQRRVKVLPDGTVAFPLVGQSMVKGLRPQEVEERITELLKGQYRGQVPGVTVSVVNPGGLQFTVMGKVNSPGVFSPGRFVNVVEALALAGGPAPYANLKKIHVLRKSGNDVQTLSVNVKGLFNGRKIDTKNLQRIQTGDTIIVH
jgi:polysaccharide export outer membrane protein